MGFFANPSPFSDSAAGLEQLSIARVKSALDRVEINYTIDDDGDLGAGWELGVIYFLIRGNQNEIFHVQGFWRAQVEANQRSEKIFSDQLPFEWLALRRPCVDDRSAARRCALCGCKVPQCWNQGAPFSLSPSLSLSSILFFYCQLFHRLVFP